MLALCARSFKAGHAIIFFKTKQRAHRAKILFGLLGLPPAGAAMRSRSPRRLRGLSRSSPDAPCCEALGVCGRPQPSCTAT